MTSEHALAQLRHRDDTGRGDIWRLEALVHGETEHERKTASQAREQWRCRLVIEAQVLAHLLLQRRAIAPVRRLGREALDVIRPEVLGAEAAFDHRLDAVADLRARVAVDGALEGALVVIDEEPRRHDRRRLPLLLLEELQRAGDGVRGAGAERTLVVARCEALAQVDLRWKRARDPGRGLIAKVALVWNVSDPAEVLDTHGYFLRGCGQRAQGESDHVVPAAGHVQDGEHDVGGDERSQ